MVGRLGHTILLYDHGAPLEDEAAAQLFRLSKDNLADYARARERLREAGCSLRLLDTKLKEYADSQRHTGPSEAEMERLAAEAKRLAIERDRLLREELWSKAKALAENPDLIGHAVETVHMAGVVGEDAAIKATLITATSRLLAEERVLSMIRTGVSSGGKSHLMNTVARLLPDEAIYAITSASAKALVYEQEGALKHKVLMLGEAAGAIAASDTEDNPLTAMLRELLTTGSIKYSVPVRDPETGSFVTIHIEQEGPTAFITTTARENVDPEMFNRLVPVPTDESPEMTLRIQIAQISGEKEKNAPQAEERIAQHVVFQKWLQLNAPVRVRIPDDLADAILAAAGGSLPTTVRTRRDVPAFLLAVKASAAMHMAQRQRDGSGGVIAQIEDYRVAHEAFDPFFAAIHTTQLNSSEIVVVEAIEQLIREDQGKRARAEGKFLRTAQNGPYGEPVMGTDGKPVFTVHYPDGHIPSDQAKARLSYDQIAERLKMKSRKTLSNRVKLIKAAGVVEATPDGSKKFGNHPLIWEVIVSSEALETAACGHFMPLPASVRKFLLDPVLRAAKVAEIRAASKPKWVLEIGENEVEA